MKLLAIVGTAAMFMVGGGILTHGLPFLRHAIETLAAAAGFLRFLLPTLLDILLGFAAGALTQGAAWAGQRIRGQKTEDGRQ
jgi:predicted DNA repair protein MutK